MAEQSTQCPRPATRYELKLWIGHSHKGATYRVTLDDDGVLFDAAARHVRIAWDDLVSVSPVAVAYGSRVLAWRRRRGKGVRTPMGFPLLHRMLSEVEQRAPHVHVSS